MTCDVYDVLIDTQRELGALLRIHHWRITCTPMPEVMDDTVALVDRRQELAVERADGCAYGLAAAERDDGDGGPGQPGSGGASSRRKDGTRLVLLRVRRQCGAAVVFFTLEMTAELGEHWYWRRVRPESVAYPSGQALAGGGGYTHTAETDDTRCRACMSTIRRTSTSTSCRVIAKITAAKGLLGLLIINYLQLLATVNPGVRVNRGGGVQPQAEGAGALGVPVMVSSQLNRQAEDRAGSPELRHLRENGP